MSLVQKRKITDNTDRRSFSKKYKSRISFRTSNEKSIGFIRERVVKQSEDWSNVRVGNTLTGLDHTVSYNEPTIITQVEMKDTSAGVSYYYVEPTFNFLSLEWEQFFSTRRETSAPCIYSETDFTPDLKAFPKRRINRQTSVNFNLLLKDNHTAANQVRHENVMFVKNYNYKSDNYKKKDYPYYINIALANRTNTTFRDKLVELNLFNLLLEDYLQSEKQTRRFGNLELSIFNLETWIGNSDFSIGSDNLVVLGDARMQDNKFTRGLKKLEFLGFLRKKMKEKQRTLKEILTGQPCYSEVLFYRVDKFDEQDVFIQTFWIPAEDTFNLMDTQVKYGVKYKYQCFSYNVVVGADYKYTVRNNHIDTTINHSVQLVEIPMFQDECRIVQPPQPMPEIMFHNNKYSRSEIKMSLQLNPNTYIADFIPLEPFEEDQNDLIDEYNTLKRKNYFHYETEHAFFEVFKMEQIPRTYDEVDNFKLADLRNPSPSISATLFDRILMDKPYYYVARSINSHGLLSNPTPIYEVRLTEDADETFLHVDVVGFIQKKQEVQNTVDFSKFIQLIPASDHTIFNSNQESIINARSLYGKIDKVILGIAKNPIWGEKFKFRFTSNDTGKKIDFNVTVKLTKKKTLEDF